MTNYIFHPKFLNIILNLTVLSLTLSECLRSYTLNLLSIESILKAQLGSKVRRWMWVSFYKRKRLALRISTSNRDYSRNYIARQSAISFSICILQFFFFFFERINTSTLKLKSVFIMIWRIKLVIDSQGKVFFPVLRYCLGIFFFFVFFLL